MQANRYFLKTVAAAALIAGAGLANAAGSTSVDVTASVPGVCKFTSTTMSAIALGSMDPSTVGATGISNTGNITYNCTKGLTPVVSKTAGGTTLTETTDSTKTIPYSFSLGTPEVGVGFASSSKVVATASVTQADVQGAAAGSYKDTVTLSINN